MLWGAGEHLPSVRATTGAGAGALLQCQPCVSSCVRFAWGRAGLGELCSLEWRTWRERRRDGSGSFVQPLFPLQRFVRRGLQVAGRRVRRLLLLPGECDPTSAQASKEHATHRVSYPRKPPLAVRYAVPGAESEDSSSAPANPTVIPSKSQSGLDSFFSASRLISVPFSSACSPVSTSPFAPRPSRSTALSDVERRRFLARGESDERGVFVSPCPPRSAPAASGLAGSPSDSALMLSP
eukprot:1371209-Rhodomonas_salina.1